MAHRVRSAALMLAAACTLATAARAADPAARCQKATVKALSGCVRKLGAAEVKCFQKTGAACLSDDRKRLGALARASDAIVRKCADASAVTAAGYAPLAPDELGDRLAESCTLAVDDASARVFGPDGTRLAGADAAEAKCLATAGREASRLLAGTLRALGRCAGRGCDEADLDRSDAKAAGLSQKSAAKLAKKCGDLAGLVGLDPAAFASEAAGRAAALAASPCDPIDPSHCMFPFTNDYFAMGDSTSPTGRRLHFASQAMPVNFFATPVDPTKWNAADGFSVGPVLLFQDEGLDLAASAATPITDIATSVDPAAPFQLIDAETGERQLLWLERDTAAGTPAERALIARVGRNLENGHRYLVAAQGLRDGTGALRPASPVFAAYRDRTPTSQLPVEARRPHMEALFDELEGLGLARADLQLAWDFTTQSTQSTAGALLAMRDDALGRVLGSAAPAFTVDSVEEPYTAEILRRIDGTFQVPLYLTDGGVPGSELRLGPDGLPVNEGDFFTASYRCLVPLSATTAGGPPAVPARAALYGHGLLGSANETSASHVRALASEYDFVICGTDWTGFADEDEDFVYDVLADFSNFPRFIERQHQGVLNFMVLGRLLLHPDGFASDPAFQVGGESVIDPSGLYYDGNSQGGILGGVLAAFSQDIERFVLGVPGINYSTLLNRSVDFEPFDIVLRAVYPNGLDRATLLGVAQILWDRTDPNGHVRHTTSDTYPNTPPKKLLYHVAFGDHQVAPVTVEVAARSNGASIHTPTLAPGKVVPDVTPYYGIPAIPAYPFDGSAVVVWDSGNPAPPTSNMPPATLGPTDPEWTDLLPCAQNFDSDPHECPRRQPEARLQKSEFLRSDGAVVDVCSGMACLAPAF